MSVTSTQPATKSYTPALVLFDLDGTLIDSAKDLHASVNEMLVELERQPVPLPSVKIWIGNGIDRLVHRSLTGSMDGEVEPQVFVQARTIFNLAYDKNNGVYATIYPGVIDALNRLASLGIPQACVTNKDERFTHSLLERSGLAGYFDQVIAGDTLANKKPHPQPLLYAAAQQGAEPADCVMVGDSLSDLKAGKAAGFSVFCVTYGYNQGVEFDQLPLPQRPDGILDSLVQLPCCQH